MKTIHVLLLFLATPVLFASEIFSYQLSKTEKLEGTYTADIGNGNSIHFAILKNTDTKSFEMTPFYVDASRKVKRLQAFTSKQMFSILSYHFSNGAVCVVNYDEGKKQVQFVDFNLETGAVKKSVREMKDPPSNVFRLSDRTLLVTFDKKKHIVDMQTVTDSEHIVQTQVAISKDNEKLFRALTDQTPDAINQHEFVSNGSIMERKGYLMGDELVYTMEKGKQQMQLFRFAVQGGNDFAHSVIETGFAKETKDVSNYYYDKKMVFLGVGKQDIQLKTFDALTSLPLRQISLAENLKGIVADSTLQQYTKTALKSAIKSTVTINKTKAGKLAFRLDNVEQAKYNYHYNWYSHHWMMHQQMIMHQQWMQQQQMMNQQRMMNSARGFGPAPILDESLLYLAKEKKLPSIEFVLDADLQTANHANEETIYKNIDKDKYLDIYKDNKTMKNLTSSFTDTDMRYICYNPKTKTISIAFDPL